MNTYSYLKSRRAILLNPNLQVFLRSAKYGDMFLAKMLIWWNMISNNLAEQTTYRFC